MAWWPFGRKRRKNDKKTPSSVTPHPPSSAPRQTLPQEVEPTPGPPPVEELPSPPAAQDLSNIHPALRDPRIEEVGSAVNEPRTPSRAGSEVEYFGERQTPVTSPSRKRFSRKISAEDITALPAVEEIERSPHLRPVPDSEVNKLSNKRSFAEKELQRQKTTKKRREERDRQEQIRAMSSPIQIPKRAGTETSGLQSKGSKRFRSATDQRVASPGSTTSLPTAPSQRSSMTAMSDSHGFEVGTLDIFSARPRLRYSLQHPISSPIASSNAPSRADSKRDKEREWAKEEELRMEKEKGKERSKDRDKNNRPTSGLFQRDLQPFKRDAKTIDDLADDLDSGSLRQLMERDQKRKEAKRKQDEERARKRLERHAARAEGRSRSGTTRSRRDGPVADVPVPPIVDPGSSTMILEPARQEYFTPEEGRSPAVEEPTETPFAEYGIARSLKSGRSLHEPETPYEEPVIQTAQTVRYSQASMSPPTSPIAHTRTASSMSQIAPPTVLEGGQVVDTPDRRTSEASTKRSGGPLAALFRRGGTKKASTAERAGVAPSEGSFSNTSRESMSRQPLPAHLQETGVFRRSSSGAPSRTKSKFREDLPELPPASQDDVPEAVAPVEPVPVIPSGAQPEGILAERGITEPGEFPAESDPPSATLLSQSLASVDSEGSWLTGKPRKRSSQQMGRSVLAKPTGTTEIGSQDDPIISQGFEPPLAVPTQRIESYAGDGSESEQADAGQAEVAEPVRHGEVARQVTLVERADRAKSTEGLLGQFDEEDYPSPSSSRASNAESDTSPVSPDTPKVQRATSVQHARQVSAGSAKLLDIPARKDSKRDSGEVEPPADTMDQLRQPAL